MSIESPLPIDRLSSCELISRQVELLGPSLSLSHLSPDPGGVQNYPGITLSSNPPNPRNVFRLGDWMYANPALISVRDADDLSHILPNSLLFSIYDHRNHFKGVPPPSALRTILGEFRSHLAPPPLSGFQRYFVPPLFLFHSATI
jgi:hypothetical protein